MEEIVTCSICAQEFESLQVIPKMLECGHTFCSPCVTNLFQKSPSCPNCRAEIKGNESSLPINYSILKIVDIYNSKCCSVKETSTSIDVLKKECMKKKDIFLKKKNHITSSLDILDKCLENLEELTASKNQKTDIDNEKRILKEVDEDLKKTNDIMSCDDIKSSISIFLSSFRTSEEFLMEILRRIQGEEEIFAVHKIGDEVKYGRVSYQLNFLLFHSLTLLEVPTNSSLIWFDELKQCVYEKNFCTFIEVCGNEKNIKNMVIIKMLDKQFSHHFIKTCTGEFGPTYKGAILSPGKDNNTFKTKFRVDYFIENNQQSNRAIDYNFSYETSEHFTYKFDEMVLNMPYVRPAAFEILLPLKAIGALPGTIGKVVSPTNVTIKVGNENSPSQKIVDCGIALAF